MFTVLLNEKVYFLAGDKQHLGSLSCMLVGKKVLKQSCRGYSQFLQECKLELLLSSIRTKEIVFRLSVKKCNLIFKSRIIVIVNYLTKTIAFGFS